MANLSVLSTVNGPWIFQTFDSFDRLVIQIKRHIGVGIDAVVLEGRAMSGIDTFYNELIEKLNLPDYFGRNLNALDECMVDLEWLLDGHPLVVIIRDAELMLEERNETFEGFIRVMRDTGEEWSKALAEGNEWDRPAVPFHTIFDYCELEAFNAHDFAHLDIRP